MESGARMHEDQPRMQALLRRKIRRTIPRRTQPSIRAGLRHPARAREARPAASMALRSPDFCKFNERSVPRSSPYGIHRSRRSCDADRQVAHVSSSHETTRATANVIDRRAQLVGFPFKCMVGCERRRPGTWPAEIGLAAIDKRSRQILVCRAAVGRSRQARSDRNRLGNSRRRKRPSFPNDGSCVG